MSIINLDVKQVKVYFIIILSINNQKKMYIIGYMHKMKYKFVQLKLSKKIKNIFKFGDLMNLAKNNLSKTRIY